MPLLLLLSQLLLLVAGAAKSGETGNLPSSVPAARVGARAKHITS